MKTQNYRLLNNWLCQTISDNPQIVKEATEVIDIYSALNRIFLQDMQLAMKDIAKEVLLIKKQ